MRRSSITSSSLVASRFSSAKLPAVHKTGLISFGFTWSHDVIVASAI